MAILKIFRSKTHALSPEILYIIVSQNNHLVELKYKVSEKEKC